MSRHNVRLNKNEFVIVGWDPGCDSFFMYKYDDRIETDDDFPIDHIGMTGGFRMLGDFETACYLKLVNLPNETLLDLQEDKLANR